MTSTELSALTAPLVIQAREQRARLQDVIEQGGCSASRARHIADSLDWHITNATTREAIIHVKGKPEMSALFFWLREWQSAIDGACWASENADYADYLMDQRKDAQLEAMAARDGVA